MNSIALYLDMLLLCTDCTSLIKLNKTLYLFFVSRLILYTCSVEAFTEVEKNPWVTVIIA